MCSFVIEKMISQTWKLILAFVSKIQSLDICESKSSVSPHSNAENNVGPMRFRATSTWFMGVTVGYTSYSLACRLTTRYKACLLNDSISVVSPSNQPSTTRYPFRERERGVGYSPNHFEVNKEIFPRPMPKLRFAIRRSANRAAYHMPLGPSIHVTWSTVLDH